jgi:quinolinate synthase
MSSSQIESEIRKLKKEKNAIILGHYYQNDDIQEISDFIGDSLDLSKKAADAKSDIIVFCGVTFMAEVAKILNPNAKVLVPDLKAGCSLEDSCQPKEFKKFCDEHPDHIVISYINCSAEIKALSDIICTSSNAEKIIRSIDPDQEIIFAPDRHLGAYLEKITGRKMKLWNGSCIVHEQFSYKSVVRLKERHQNAKVIAHPECPEELLNISDFIGSTTKLIQYVQEHTEQKTFIILTEPNIIHKMKKLRPDAEFIPVSGISREKTDCTHCNNCPFMELNTMEKLLDVLKTEKNEIILEESIANAAKKSLNAMLHLS